MFSSNTKYITFDTGMADAAILFPAFLNHGDIANAMLARYPGWEILGAGFVSLTDDDSAAAYGESFSLGVKSRPEDTKLVCQALDLHDPD